jgi:hypothetical protein
LEATLVLLLFSFFLLTLDEMPMYVAVVKAESIEEHVDTQPPSQNIYPVTILQANGQGFFWQFSKHFFHSHMIFVSSK